MDVKKLSPDAQLLWKELRLAGFKKRKSVWYPAGIISFVEPNRRFLGHLHYVAGVWYVNIPGIVKLPNRGTDVGALQDLVNWWRAGSPDYYKEK